MSHRVYRLPDVSPPRKSPTDIALIVQRTIGPIIFNVVASAVDLIRQREMEAPPLTSISSGGSRGTKRKRNGVPVDVIAWVAAGLQNKQEFAAPCTMAIRTGDKKFTLSIFEKAKFVITGAANENVAVQGLHDAVAYIAKKTGIVFIPQAIRINNIQAVVYMYTELNLPEINRHLKIAANAQYNPQLIKMVKIVLREPRVTILIYRSGRLVLIGTSQRAQLVDAMNIVVPFLAHFVTSPIHDPTYIRMVEGETQKILRLLDTAA